MAPRDHPSRAIASLIAACLLAGSPGLAPYEAAAAVLRKAPSQASRSLRPPPAAALGVPLGPGLGSRLGSLAEEVAAFGELPPAASAENDGARTGEHFQRAAGLGQGASGGGPSEPPGPPPGESPRRGGPSPWISLPVLVGFLVSSEAPDRLSLLEAVRAGEDPSSILRGHPGRPDYWAGLMQDFIQAQFSNRTRPVVEIVSNAVDAVQGEPVKEIQVTVGIDGATVVLDPGKGMSGSDVMEKLLIPLISGKEAQETIGRFGVGFYSVLQYLKTPEHRLSVETSDGTEAMRVVFRAGRDGPEARFEALDASTRPRGAGVSLETRLPTWEVHQAILEALRFNQSAAIFVNGRRINDLAESARVAPPPPGGASAPEALTDGQVSIRVWPRSSGLSAAHLTVNGVTIFSKPLLGLNVPGQVVVDFPNRTQLVVSRDKLLVDSFTLESARRAVDLAAAQADPYPLFNALLPLLESLQSGNPSPRNEDNIELYLKRAAARRVKEDGRAAFPDDLDLHDLAVDGAALLAPPLFESLEAYRWPFPEYSEFQPSFFGARHRMLLAPLRDSNRVLLVYKNTLFLNERYRPQGVIGKAALQALLETKRLGGRILTGRNWLDRILGGLEWVARFYLAFVPLLAYRAAYGLKDLLAGSRRGQALPSQAKAFGFEGIQEEVERSRTWQKTLFQWAATAAAGLSVGPGLAATSLAGAAGLLGMAAALITAALASRLAYKGAVLLFYVLEDYQPRYGALSGALISVLLAAIPEIAGFKFAVLGILLQPGPFLMLAGLGLAGVFLWGLRKLFYDAAVTGLAAGLLLLRGALLPFHWWLLPKAARKTIRVSLSWRSPKSWLAAVLAVRYARTPEGIRRLEADREGDSLATALKALADPELSFARELRGLPLLLGRAPEVFEILQTYDPAYLRGFLHMAGVLVHKHPRLLLAPGTSKRYVDVWQESLLVRDRDSVQEALRSLELYAKDGTDDVPRAIRPYVLYLLRQSELQAYVPARGQAPAAPSVEFELSDLIALYLQGGGAASDPQGLAAELSAARSSPLRAKVAERALANSVNFQSSNPYIFIRELMQNSLDAANTLGLPASRRRFEITPVAEETGLGVRFRDHAGMDFRTVTQFLLLPNASTKRGQEGAVGHFGHGFLSILKGAEEVLVKTSDGGGRTILLRLLPRRQGELVVGVRVGLSVVPEAFQGTEIEWRRKTAVSALEVANVKSQAISFGSLVNQKELAILWRGKVLNKPKVLLADAPTLLGEITLHRFLGENTLTQRGLLIKELDNDLTQYLPPRVREALLKRGIVVGLPPGVDLIRDRSDLAHKQDVLPILGNGLARAALQAVARLHLEGDISIDELFPYDFARFGAEYAESVPPAIAQDARSLSRGQAVADPAPYSNPTNLAMLLGSLPTFSPRFTWKRQRLSLLGAFTALKEKKLHWLQLPPHVARFILNRSLYAVLLRAILKLALGAGALYLALRFGSEVWQSLSALAPDKPAVTLAPLDQAFASVEKLLRYGTDIPHNPSAPLANPFAEAWDKLWGLMLKPAALLAAFPLLFLFLGGAWLHRLVSAPPALPPARVQPSQDAYWAFASWADRVSTLMLRAVSGLGGKEARTVFHMSLFGNSVEAPQGKGWVSWNVRDSFWGGPVGAFRKLLGGGREGRVVGPLRGLLKKMAHELAHVGESPGQWSHDEGQRAAQGLFLEAALRLEPEIAAAAEEARRGYLGRLASPLSFSQAVADSKGINAVKDAENWLSSSDPRLLPSLQRALEEAQAQGLDVSGEAGREADGRWAIRQAHPHAPTAIKAAKLVAAAGVPVAARGFLFLAGQAAKTPGAVMTQEGVLLVPEQALAQAQDAGQEALDFLAWEVLLHGMNHGMTDDERYHAGSEIARLKAGKGSTRELLKRLRMGRAWRLLRRAMMWALLAGGLLGFLYTFLLFPTLLGLVASGAISFVPHPNAAQTLLILLPAAWPFARRLLDRWWLKEDRSYEEADGMPGADRANPLMRGFINLLGGKKFPMWGVAIVFLLAGFLEEYLFRYLLFHAMGSWAAAYWLIPALPALIGAALLSAFLFSLMHFPNWRNLKPSDALVLTLRYYGFLGLVFTGLYWLGGIWVATLGHAFYNSYLLWREKREAQEKERLGAEARQRDKELAENAQAPAPPASAALPRARGTRLVFFGLFPDEPALVLYAQAARLDPWARVRVLRELLKLPFLLNPMGGSRPEDHAAVKRLERELDGELWWLGRRRFLELMGEFVAGLPPEMKRAALAYLLLKARGSAPALLADSTRSLEPEAALFRGGLERDLNSWLAGRVEGAGPSLGLAVRVFRGEELLREHPDWIKPVLQISPDGSIQLWVQERLLYAMKERSPKDLGRVLAEQVLEALQEAGKSDHDERLALASLGRTRRGHFELSELEKKAAAEVSPRRFWLLGAWPELFWLAVAGVFVLVPVLHLLGLLASGGAAAGLAFLAAKGTLAAAALSNPLFLAALAGALLLDWGAKLWVNRFLAQSPDDEGFRFPHKTLAIGPWRLSASITNVMHRFSRPRLWATFLLPLGIFLGGVDISQAPVFAGLLLGGALANAAEALLRGGATGWIPLRRGRWIANLADLLLLTGLLGPWLIALPQLPIGLALGWLAGRVAARLYPAVLGPLG